LSLPHEELFILLALDRSSEITHAHFNVSLLATFIAGT
jgi:hypothetical protein